MRRLSRPAEAPLPDTQERAKQAGGRQLLQQQLRASGRGAPRAGGLALQPRRKVVYRHRIRISAPSFLPGGRRRGGGKAPQATPALPVRSTMRLTQSHPGSGIGCWHSLGQKQALHTQHAHGCLLDTTSADFLSHLPASFTCRGTAAEGRGVQGTGAASVLFLRSCPACSAAETGREHPAF